MQKPSFWRIAVAYLMDMVVEIMFFPLVVAIPLLVLGRAFLSLHNAIGSYGNVGDQILFIVLCGSLALSFYYVVLETWLGASVGKLIVGICVEPRSIGRVFGAYWLDMILVSGSVFLTSSMYSSAWPEDGHGAGLLGFGAGLLVYIVDFIFVDGLFGSSVGKVCLGVKVYKK